ncbi:MAG TPA: metallophosphoesterase family protein [Planctomycetota bacterium]|nr:metallophosphoesterase family protein [Planctomycetota bacterium]
MRRAILSDLHGNREALEAVWAHLQGQAVDDLVCLGDVVGYGPEPEFCVDLVRGHARWCLMGNHDEALFRDASDFNSYARSAIEYTRRRMEPRWYHSAERKARWLWLSELPLTVVEGRFHFYHGSPRDPVREYVLSTDGILNPDKLRAIFDAFDGVGFAGHTHQPGMHTDDLRWHGLGGAETLTLPLPEGRKAFVNVGSTGQPRDGDHRACYAILEEHQITWHRVEYDFRATQAKILGTGVLPEILARRLAIGR